MADKPSSGTPEQVALELLHLVAAGETVSGDGTKAHNKEWILDTYADCLRATKGNRIPK